jgi:hypothetical protein
MKISRESIEKFFIFFFLFTGYLNTVLRLNVESNLTLFRILLPLGYSYFLWRFTKSAVMCTLVLLLFLFYGFITSEFLFRLGGFSYVFFLHYATIIYLLFFVGSVIKEFGLMTVHRHLKSVYVLMLGLAIFQFVTDFQFPNTNYVGSINIFYWVDNDFSAALAAFIPILLVDKTHQKLNKLLALIGIIIIAYNGSRIALLAMFVFILFLLVNRVKWLGFILFLLGSILIFIVLREYKLGGDSLQQLITDPVEHIVTLTPYGRGGSIYDRTDALIFGIRELLSSCGFGIGPGNTTRMLEEIPEYFLPTAQSMHNFVAQIIVEYGWLIIFSFLFLGVRLLKKPKRVLIFVYLITIGLASLSQSVGLFSNYYFFVAIFFGYEFIEMDQSDNQAIH